MPTAAANTWGNAGLEPCYRGNDAKRIHVALSASLTLARGTVLGETATAGEYAAYVDTTATDPAKAILEYDVTTDGSKNITISGFGELGVTRKTCPAFVSGFFRTTELTGLDAAALVNLGAHLISGTVADGVLCIPGSA
jgi:hypothetical protein